MSLPAGMKLGPYEIIAPIGAGGMGEVYRARDARLRRDVAVKVLPEGFAHDRERMARFEREAMALAALNHPNILFVLDVGPQEGMPYVVMELLEGETLRDAVIGGPMPVSKAMDVALQIARGLIAAHEKGIVHRDLKPGNIFLTRGGNVKILDFGLVRMEAPAPAFEAGGSQEITADIGTGAGAVMGTMGYMAPEQARGLPADARSDIFSFGVVLYEMLSGKRPFDRGTGADTLAAILKEDPPPLPPGSPPALARIVRECLEKRPEDRFSSAHDLALALQAISGTGEAPSTAKAAPQGVAGWLLEHWVKLVAGATAAVLVALVAGWAVWHKTGKEEKKGSALEPKRVVVAVFENQTGDKSLDSLSEMASDWITEGLSRIGAVEVVPTSLVFELAKSRPKSKAGGDPVLDLAETTGAGLVVSGTFYVQGSTLLVQAKLTDATTRKMLYAAEPASCPKDKPMEALQEVRNRMVDAVAARRLTKRDLLSQEAKPPSYEAYKEFLAGDESFGSDYPAEIAHFNRALELDPDFVAPRFDLMAAYVNLGDYPAASKQLEAVEQKREQLTLFQRRQADYWRASLAGRNEEAVSVGRELVKLAPGDIDINYNHAFDLISTNRLREALQVLEKPIHWELIIDPSKLLGFSYFANLWLARHLLGEHEQELADALRCREVYPDLLTARISQVSALIALGRLDEARKVVQECLSVRARLGTPGFVMWLASKELRAHGHREESLRMASRAAEWYRDHLTEDLRTEDASTQMALSLYQAERWEEARAAFASLAKRHPEDISFIGYLGTIAARRGNRAEAATISESLRKSQRVIVPGENTYHRACIAAQLGQKEQALDLLREAVSQGFMQRVGIGLFQPYAYAAHIDMDLEPLHGYAPYEELVKPKG